MRQGRVQLQHPQAAPLDPSAQRLLWAEPEGKDGAVGRKLGQVFLIMIAAAMLASPGAASDKYQKYVSRSLSDLLLMCVEGDDNGCYFYAGMQAKQGNLKEAHDAYLICAQNAKNRAGFVCMFQLARLYESGQGVDQDLVQAYRWFTVLTQLRSQQDLRTAATSQRQQIMSRMTPQQISLAEALSKRGGPGN